MSLIIRCVLAFVGASAASGAGHAQTVRKPRSNPHDYVRRSRYVRIVGTL